jgi:hypothetical protein
MYECMYVPKCACALFNDYGLIVFTSSKMLVIIECVEKEKMSLMHMFYYYMLNSRHLYFDTKSSFILCIIKFLENMI